MSKHYPVEQRERALKMVLNHLNEYRSGVRGMLGDRPEGRSVSGPESLRRRELKAQVDTAQRPRATTAEQQRIRDLEREVNYAHTQTSQPASPQQ